jgi:ketosteroid isomerase-like protein
MPTKQRVQDLISYVEQGRIVEGIREFYADDAVMRENLNPPTVGKAANIERETGFEAYIATWHHARANAVLVDGDRAVINWDLEYTGTDGKRWHYDEIAVQRWRGDRIVDERFFYDSATLAVEKKAAA